MELAERIHQCIINNASSHKLLDLYNQVENGDILSRVYDYIVENYDYSPHEVLTEVLSVDELYAISSTEKFIRNPDNKNLKIRDHYYSEIGYNVNIRS